MEKLERNGRIVWQKGNHSQHKYFQSLIKFKFNTSCLYFMQSRNRRLYDSEELVGVTHRRWCGDRARWCPSVIRSFEKSSLVGIKKLEASILLKVPAVGIKVSIEGEIKLE